MSKKKPKARTPYSDEKLYRYLQRELRRTFRNSPLKQAAWKNGIIAGRRGWYRCHVCGRAFKRPDMAIDHVAPVVQTTCPPLFTHLGRVILFARMFCPLNNLKPICDACHADKTKSENAERRATYAKRAA